jgi:TatD DNase family protein
MIDFHCHLDLFPDPADTARLAGASRTYVLSVTTTPKAWRNTSKLARPFPRIRTALGLHPQVAHERRGELALFEALLPETDYIGEVGLDGSAESKRHMAVQRQVFETILDMSARAGGRILSIHSRSAPEQVLECLRNRPNAGTPILHWFSGSTAQLRRAVDQGCWFSVGLPMTKSERGRTILANLPRDRVLTETDGPFVQNDGKAMGPADIGTTIAALARVWNIPVDEVSALLLENLRSIGRLAPNTQALSPRSQRP